MRVSDVTATKLVTKLRANVYPLTEVTATATTVQNMLVMHGAAVQQREPENLPQPQISRRLAHARPVWQLCSQAMHAGGC